MDRLARYAPLSGLVVALLFGVGNALWALEIPATDASGPEIARWYADTSTGIVVGASLSLVAVAIFVWWGAVLRERLELEAAGRSHGLALAAFGGVLLASAAGLGAETINMTAGLRAQHEASLSPGSAQVYFDVSQILGFNAAGIGLAVVLAATAVVALRSGALLPRWLAVLMLVTALTLLTPLSRVTFALAFLVLPVLSVLMYRRPEPA